jgi:hypothetical protein
MILEIYDNPNEIKSRDSEILTRLITGREWLLDRNEKKRPISIDMT